MPEVALVSRLTGRSDLGGGVRQIDLGRLSMALEPLEARSIHVDGEELIRRLHVAVRDEGWGTAPAADVQARVEVTDASVDSTMSALCRDRGHQIALRWRGRLTARADGSIDFSFEGEPLQTFRYGRIGICVLHPPDFAGGAYRAHTEHGWIEGRLEKEIAPQLPGEHGYGEPLIPAFDELELRRDDGSGVFLEFSGDVFELEDQRNWLDASFKTYSTPLSMGPQVAEPGRRFEQRVLITPLPRRPALAGGRRLRDPDTVVQLLEVTDRRMLDLGVVHAADEQPSPTAIEGLRALGPSHLRADVLLAAGAWRQVLESASAIAEALDVPLELAVSRADDLVEEADFSALLEELRPAVARAIALRAGSVVTPPTDVAAVRRLVETPTGLIPVYGGTDVLFADLNGNRPELTGLDGVAFPLVPTVHADDDLSLVETMTIFEDVVSTARTFTASLPLAVSPVTLRMRPQTDERQPSLLAAVWTLGAVGSLARAGAEAATFYETVGMRGVLGAGERAPAYPVFHVLAELCEWRGRPVVDLRCSDRLAVAALAVQNPAGAIDALIANASPRAARVRLIDFRGTTCRVRRLNDESVLDAARDPAAFRAGAEVERVDRLDLEPYEIVWLGGGP